ncbi:MAG: OmpA family protein [Bacteroidales bacterium]|nr:OmpA family protein [Bacteroidales bacterium]
MKLVYFSFYIPKNEAYELEIAPKNKYVPIRSSIKALDNKNVIKVIPELIEQNKASCTIKVEEIYFETNKSKFENNSHILHSLNEQASYINNYKISICGYTDSIGKENQNLALGMKRAESVAKFIHKQTKIDKQNIIVESKGEALPKVSNSTDEGRRKNRRVEIILTEKENDTN